VTDPAATTAVLLREVDAEIAVAAHVLPQLGRRLAGTSLGGEPVAAIAAGQAAHLLAQVRALLGLGEREGLGCCGSGHWSSSSTMAMTSPAATWAPGWTVISVTVPSVGAVTVCCIFMASRTRIVSPALTRSPGAATTETTAPGMGATSEPLASSAAGSVNRGTISKVSEP